MMTAELDTDARANWAAVLDMYGCYLTGDRERSNSHIASDVTLWGAEHEPLDRLRRPRPAA